MKTDVLNLVATLSNGTADAALTPKFYDDALIELARENWFTDARLITTTADTAPVNLGDDVVNLLGLVYDDVELEEVPLRLLESIDPQWRDRTGYPRSYVVEDVNRKSADLYPAPFVASNPNLGTFDEPLGLDYPTYNLVCFFSYAPLEPQQPFFFQELVIALRVLALEHSRESDHVDMEFSQMADAWSNVLKRMLV